MIQDNLPALYNNQKLIKSSNNAILLVNQIIDEGNAEYWYRRGVEHKTKKEWDAAFYSYAKAININPKEAKYYIAKAYISSKLNKIVNVIDSICLGFECHKRWDDFINILSEIEWSSLYDFLKNQGLKGGREGFVVAVVQLVKCNSLKEEKELFNILEDLNTIYDKDLRRNCYNLKGIAKRECCGQDYKYYGNYEEYEIETKDALICFNKALEVEPNFISYYNLYLIYCIIGSRFNDYDKAIISIDNAINLEPDNIYAYEERARINYPETSGVEDCLRAIDDFNMLINLRPQCSKYYFSRGMIKYWNLKIQDEALEDFNSTINFFDGNTDDLSYIQHAFLNRGYIKYSKEDYSGAKEDVLKILDLCEQYSSDCDLEQLLSNMLLGEISNATEDYLSSIYYLTKCIALFNADSINSNACYFYYCSAYYYGIHIIDAYLSRAFAYKAIGETKKAEEDMRSIETIKNEKSRLPF